MTIAVAGMPDRRQSLLLRACFKEGEEARAAFADWTRDLDFDRLDTGSVRLLPLLDSRLEELGARAPCAGLIRGVARRAFLQNQLLLKALRSALPEMRKAGVDVILLKGCALAASVYPRASMRPMLDIDMLTPRSSVAPAVDALRALGWEPDAAPPQTAADFALQHALSFRSPDGRALSIDLHWRLCPWKFDAEAEKALWANAEPTSDGQAMTLGSADMLLHVCDHGLRWSDIAPIRWIADALMILRSRAIDWEHFLAQAERSGLVLQARIALDYLAIEMGANIPDSVRERLAGAPAKGIDRTLFALYQIPPDKRPFLPNLRVHAYRARTMVGASPAAFFSYAQGMRAGRAPGATMSWLWRRAMQ